MTKKPKQPAIRNLVRKELNRWAIYRRIRTFQREKLDDLRYERLEPLFFGIGVQKGGTTALYKYLAEHAELIAPPVKEIDFFYCESQWKSGKRQYFKKLPFNRYKKPGLWTYDISPHYMLGGELVAKRIKDFYPAAKIVALLRNPVSRAFSAWNMCLRHNAKNPNWYYDMYRKCKGSQPAKELVRRNKNFGRDFLADCREELAQRKIGRHIEMPIIEFGFYKSQLAGFYQHFSRDDIIVIESDEFFRDTANVLARLECFLGLSESKWSEKELFPHYQGNYQATIPISAEIELTEYYRMKNKGLEDLVGLKFSWM